MNHGNRLCSGTADKSLQFSEILLIASCVTAGQTQQENRLLSAVCLDRLPISFIAELAEGAEISLLGVKPSIGLRWIRQ